MASPLKHLSFTTLAVLFLLGGIVKFSSPARSNSPANQRDLELQVGIVQRFGKKPTDTLTLQAKPGDRLNIRVQMNEGERVITSNTAKLEIVMQPLPEPKVEERIVLSTHRSFESAEESANRWRAKGIEVEIAQPERWQVWAKREVYNTPLLRRLLLQSVRSQGYAIAYIDTKILTQQPQASLVVNGYRYTRDYLHITAGQNIIQVDPVGDARKRLYAGSLRLQPNAYGTYTLVNQVPLEAYLRGVVPHEIGTWAPQPVLETQTILARTYALRNLRRFAIDNYQLCADTQCQVYNGLSGAAPETDRAIAATRGQVLTYGNELVDAVYSSTTGGITAPFHDVWDGAERPYLRAIVDSAYQVWDLSRFTLAEEQNFRRFIQQRKGFNEEGESSLFRWRADTRLETLNKELREYLKAQQSSLARFGTIQRMDVVQRSSSGRVLKLRVTTDQGTVDLEKDNILIAFEAPNSTLFYLEPIYGAGRVLRGYAFIGGGLGHGVGLSQTGSYRLGRLGWSSNRILSFYYPGTQIQPINDAIVFWQDNQQTSVR